MLGQMPLTNTPLINISALKNQVETQTKQAFTWFYSDVTGSTNSDLLNHKHAYSIAVSESQSQGRGQHGNSWQASHADNLLFSIALPITINETLGLVPIKIGLVIKEVLNKAGFNDINLKWPNDIFYKQKKLGGILIESISQDNKALIIIGVGLNVNMPYTHNDAFISLSQNKTINRTPLLAQCLISIINLFKHHHLDTVPLFNHAHLFHLKPIKFNTGKTIITGVCQGINEQGQLLIKTQQGLIPHSTGSIVMENN